MWCEFQVTTYTADKKQAGTDARVSLTLHGDALDATLPHVLTASNQLEPFARNQVGLTHSASSGGALARRQVSCITQRTHATGLWAALRGAAPPRLRRSPAAQRTSQ